MPLSKAQIELARQIIEYMRVAEPDFVEGEVVAYRKNQRAYTDDGQPIIIPAGTVGIVRIVWHDEFYGLPAHCWFLGVQIKDHEGDGYTGLNMEQELVSVDPVWSRPPTDRKHSLGKANYER